MWVQEPFPASTIPTRLDDSWPPSPLQLMQPPAQQVPSQAAASRTGEQVGEGKAGGWAGALLPHGGGSPS